MTTKKSLALTLLCLLVPGTLRALSPAEPLKAAAKPAPSAMVSIKSVEPASVEVGGLVTITGTGLDQATAILFGDLSPEIVEKSAKSLTFLAPRAVQNSKGYDAIPYVVVAGKPIVSAGVKIRVNPKAGAEAKAPPARDTTEETLLSQDVTVSSASPKSFPLSFGSSRRIRIVLEGNGEVQVTLQPSQERGARAASQASYSGRLSWLVGPEDLLENPPAGVLPKLEGPFTLKIVTDSAKEVTLKVHVTGLHTKPQHPQGGAHAPSSASRSDPASAEGAATAPAPK